MTEEIKEKIITAIEVLEKDKDSKGFFIVTDLKAKNFNYNIKIEIEKDTNKKIKK